MPVDFAPPTYRPLVKPPKMKPTRTQYGSDSEPLNPVTAIPMAGGQIGLTQQSPVQNLPMRPGVTGLQNPVQNVPMIAGQQQSGPVAIPLSGMAESLPSRSDVPPMSMHERELALMRRMQLARDAAAFRQEQINNSYVRPTPGAPLGMGDVQMRGAVPQPTPVGPATPEDYSSIGIAQPQFAPEYRKAKTFHSGGIGDVQGGYTDVVGPRFQYTPQEQAQMSRQRSYGQSSFGDEGLMPDSYRRFARGGQFIGGGQAEPPASMQNLKTGTRIGNAEVVEVNGRKVVVGDGHRAGERPLDRPRIEVGVKPPPGGYTQKQLDNQAAYRQKMDDRAGALAEGRRNRAIEKYGLSHLAPTYNYGKDPRASSTDQSGATGMFNPSGQPQGNAANRAAELDRSLSHGIFADSAKSGFDGKIANVSQSLDYYINKKANWSGEDRTAFRSYLDARANNDRSGFGAELANILSDEVNPPWNYMGPDQVAAVNEIRQMYGKPPVEFENVELFTGG